MSDKIKITIVEDDFLIGNFIHSTLTNIGYQVLDICNSYDSFIESFTNTKPDILLLDIKIEGTKTGLDIAEYLQDYKSIPFIFISSLHDKKTIDEAKKMKPASYLIKPFDEDDLYAVVEIALVNHAQKTVPQQNAIEETIVLPDFIFIKQKQAFLKMAWKDIIYLESTGNYLKIVLATGTYTIRQTIQSLEKVLPAYFFKVHRSFIVNLYFIKQIESNSILLTNNIDIPVSREIYPKLIENIRVING
jgi:two-component system, LytTR family, response regulator LytT